MTIPEGSGPTDLDARYGRTAASSRKTRWVVGVSAAAFVAVFAAWLVWGGLLEAPAQFEAQDTGHDILSESEVAVRWEFSAPPGTTALCAIQALNSTFGIVGWRVIEIDASTDRTRTFVETVRTTELAVTGLIYRCWLT